MSLKITAETRIAGVVGAPVRHSLSPLIHNAWIEAAGLDAVYLAFAPDRDGFKRLVDGFRGGVVLGLNVTVPFKEEALAAADRATDEAHAGGAANLLLFHADGTVEAGATDGEGLLLALGGAGFDPVGARAAVIGAGGAARGAVAALLEAGAARVDVVNRTLERAQAVADLSPHVFAHGWSDAAAVLEGAHAVINATTLGMEGQPPLELSLDAAPKSAVVMDMVYRPLKTALLRAAERRGHPTADGLSMLIGQAVPSFEAMFMRPPPAEVDMRALCERALAGGAARR